MTRARSSGASSRPDDEPTINEAGTASFTVDGTDSFAVPGPADGLPPDDAEERSAAALARRRMLITLGAAAALLALVLVIANAGHSDSAGDDRLRGDTDGSAYTLPGLFGTRDEVTTTETGTLFGDVIGSSEYSTATTYVYDEFPVPSTEPYTYTPYTYSSPTVAPYRPTYRPTPTVAPYRPTPTVAPRRIPPVTVRTVPRTVPRTTATTSTTTTTSSTTTSTSTSTTTTTSTTTPTTPPSTAPPPPEWEPATAGLTIACGDSVRIWAGSKSLFAAVGTQAFQSTDGGLKWTGPIGGFKGTPQAYAEDRRG